MPIKILLINNAADEVKFLEELVTSWVDCEITSASLVDEALSHINNSTFDMIFLDLFLTSNELSSTFFLMDEIFKANNPPQKLVFLITKYVEEIPNDEILKKKLSKYKMADNPLDYTKLYNSNADEIGRLRYWVETISNIVSAREKKCKKTAPHKPVNHYLTALIITFFFIGGIYSLLPFLKGMLPGLNPYLAVIISCFPALILLLIIYPKASKTLLGFFAKFVGGG